MTPENDAQRPAQDPDQQPDENKSALAAINDSTVAKKANQALKSVTGTAEKVQRNPIIAHLLLIFIDDPDSDGLFCGSRFCSGLASYAATGHLR